MILLKEEKANETSKDMLGDLFPNDEDEQGKQVSTLQYMYICSYDDFILTGAGSATKDSMIGFPIQWLNLK